MELFKHPIKARDLPSNKFTTGCKNLDALLNGGISCGLLTELSGESSSGKTQLCLQFLLTVQLPEREGGLNGKAIYICTQGDPPMRRLEQILNRRYPKSKSISLDQILVQRSIRREEDLSACISRLKVLLSHQNSMQLNGKLNRQVRLIIIDSLADVFRDCETDDVQSESFRARSETLFTLSATLKRIAFEFKLAVVLVNQVQDEVREALRMSLELGGTAIDFGSSSSAVMTSGRIVRPSLGLSWSQCINIRLFTARHEIPIGHAEAAAAVATMDDREPLAPSTHVLKSLQIVFAPHLPNNFCYFEVRGDGISMLNLS